MTASWYSGLISRWISAVALISSGDSEVVTRDKIYRNLAAALGGLGVLRQGVAADLATHRAECSSTQPCAFTVRDVTTADSLRRALRDDAPACQSRAGAGEPDYAPGRAGQVVRG
jgi:hypothetical protein